MSLFALPYALAGLAVVAGLLGNWWLGVADWQTAIIFSVALVACVYVAQSSSPLARVGVTAIIGVALYLKGGVDKQAQLFDQHEADKAAIHQAYADAVQEEKARQIAANAAALSAATQAKEASDAELQSLRERIRKSAEQAVNDPRAGDTALSHDAVKRINALRLRAGRGS